MLIIGRLLTRAKAVQNQYSHSLVKVAEGHAHNRELKIAEYLHLEGGGKRNDATKVHSNFLFKVIRVLNIIEFMSTISQNPKQRLTRMNPM